MHRTTFWIILPLALLMLIGIAGCGGSSSIKRPVTQ
jgi:hypothetical protein